MDNFLSNALKFSPQQRRIHISLYQHENEAICQIQDEGDGLSEEDRAGLFQKFSRLSALPTAGEHSSGLGLAICKQLVERMQGEVWAESEGKGKGSSFYFSLPLD
jgi:signal transduction histidine kinase